MSKTSQTRPIPRVETLLATAHAQYAALAARRGLLGHCGIAAEHLPEDSALMAFALLDDHDRQSLLHTLAPEWQTLRAKGLAEASLDSTPGPELRLLAHALPLLGAVQDVWQRLQETDQAEDAPAEVLRCPSRVRGLWGQAARVHFLAVDSAFLLIAPDPVFGAAPALLAADAAGRCGGSFTFPVDDGAITLTLQRRGGMLCRRVVHCAVEEPR